MVPRSMCKDDAEYFQMLRDDFAAEALQGIVTHPDTWGESTVDGLAQRAFKLADAMLRARGQS